MKKLLLILVAWFAFSGLALAVDINTADQKQLESVKGIGPAKAKAIIDYRNKNGAFKSVDDLTNVKGIGTKNLNKMRGELSVGGGSSASPKPGKATATPPAAAPESPAEPAAKAAKPGKK